MTDIHPVVVGTDGSVRASAAVTQAAEEAALRKLPLRLIYGFAPLYLATGLDPIPRQEVLTDCRAILEAEVDRIHKTFPDLEATTEVVVADPAVALEKESETATILLVGARGLGAVRRLLLGSVSTKVAAYAKCPVIVVRDEPGDPEGPIVVGMAPEEGVNQAVTFAFNEARLRGRRLRVIQSQQHAAANFEALPETSLRTMVSTRMADMAKRGEAEFEKIRQANPDVDARFEIRNIHAVDALLDTAGTASLIVVGRHGKSAIAAKLMGSVTHGVLGNAPVVAVIPED